MDFLLSGTYVRGSHMTSGNTYNTATTVLIQQHVSPSLVKCLNVIYFFSWHDNQLPSAKTSRNGCVILSQYFTVAVQIS